MPDPLDYRDPKDDAPKRRVTGAWIAFGIFCGIAAVFMSGCTFVMSNIHYTPTSPPPSSFMTNNFQWRGPLIFTAVALLILSLTMFWSHRRGNAGFVLGAFIGAGVMALIDGICFLNQW
jgi:hypothetical protein